MSWRLHRETRFMTDPLRVLILGGTAQARMLIERLAREPAVAPILSLAGRTKNPLLPAGAYRIGGFGGVAGLAAWLRAGAIDLVIDATHPFAEQMSAHAEAACREVAVPLALFTRQPWTPREGDRWNEVATAQAAASALGPLPRRVFLTVGRLQLPAFEEAPQHHYLIRSIDAPEPALTLPAYRLLLARGPFSLEEEMRLMQTEKIDVLVTKNSGGEATYAKIEAARRLAIPVILMRPPASTKAPVFYDLDAICTFIVEAAHQRASEPRGV
ncbi:MAG: cobalt-precorrin-6A reductase [Beijerinckiaceae bacterium]|nr:MAG: cobalt-precorrin-6A reductase [Beijerinckiaceae bacterium]